MGPDSRLQLKSVWIFFSRHQEATEGFKVRRVLIMFILGQQKEDGIQKQGARMLVRRYEVGHGGLS